MVEVGKVTDDGGAWNLQLGALKWGTALVPAASSSCCLGYEDSRVDRQQCSWCLKIPRVERQWYSWCLKIPSVGDSGERIGVAE